MPCETQRKRICFSHNSLSNIPFGRELEPVWNSKVHAAYCSLARLRYPTTPTTPTTPGAKKLTPMPFSETSPSFNFGCIFSPIIHRKNRCVYCTDPETCVFLDSFVVQPVQCRHRIWHLFFGPKKGFTKFMRLDTKRGKVGMEIFCWLKIQQTLTLRSWAGSVRPEIIKSLKSESCCVPVLLHLKPPKTFVTKGNGKRESMKN